MNNSKFKKALVTISVGLGIGLSTLVSAGGPNSGNICIWLNGQCNSGDAIACANYKAACE